jgi:hypothetical protein
LKVFVSLLFAAVCLLTVPAVASAEEWVVNTKLDEVDKAPGGPCETNAGTCSLRAAIEISNGSTTEDDSIVFDSNVFKGINGDTISVATPFETITDKLTIEGGACDTSAGVKGPCAGVIKAGGGSLFVVEEDDVEIQGLATNGASTAINVINASKGFVAKGDWIGFDLTGVPSGNGTGIFIDPESDGATIGGPEDDERNLIGKSSSVGLDIDGASDASIQGNYFGVTPKGDVAAANATNIKITDSTSGSGFPAENNEIGSTIKGAALTSDACDGGCNVISGATGNGIDLNGFEPNGEDPASGPTTIHGNFIGLNAAGTGTIANTGIGIWAGGAEHVTAGGLEAGDANYIAGGSEGIVSESGGEDFNALGNQIGFGSDGSEQASPAEKGIIALALDVNEDPEIENNAVRMTGGVGIESRFLTGRIIDNEVEGGGIGIRTVVGSGAGLISSNTVTAPIEVGILVESPDNDVRGNSVFSSGGAGIKVRNPPGVAMTGNTIGSSAKGDENVLESNSGAAIQVLEEASEPGSATEITLNRGSLNGGPFISLLNGANGGIAPPTAATATKSSASGTATPNATVRVFSKTESAVGELHGFLAETEADGSGNWNVTFSAVAGGTLVTATQTVSKATSQLATPVAVRNEPSGGGGDRKGPEVVCAPTHDSICGVVTAPSTKIKSGPKGKVKATTAKFKFSSPTKGAKFECKLDKGKFKPCKSPKKYKGLKLGKHVFKVRAVANGLADPTPAKRQFKIVT